MDTFDNFDSIDTSQEGQWNSSEKQGEAAREQSEKQKEKASKALSGIRRTQKDEKKSKRHSTLLARIISHIVEHDDRSAALPNVLELLELGVPSNIIISFCIIIHPTSLEIALNEFGYSNTLPKLRPRSQAVVFDADELTLDEKNYINLWLEIVFVIITEEVSSIMTCRFLEQLHWNKRKSIVSSLTIFLSLFFESLNIKSTTDLHAYASFIIDQMELKIHQMPLEDVDTWEKINW